jgi:hypothetical protein
MGCRKDVALANSPASIRTVKNSQVFWLKMRSTLHGHRAATEICGSQNFFLVKADELKNIELWILEL